MISVYSNSGYRPLTLNFWAQMFSGKLKAHNHNITCEHCSNNAAYLHSYYFEEE